MPQLKPTTPIPAPAPAPDIKVPDPEARNALRRVQLALDGVSDRVKDDGLYRVGLNLTRDEWKHLLDFLMRVKE